MLVNVFVKEDIKMKNIEIIDTLSVKVNDRLFEFINNMYHEVKEININKKVCYDGEKMNAIEKIKIFTGNIFTAEELNNEILRGINK